jgi:GDP-D-mannose dehydratase
MQWMMLQRDKPQDFVIATGVQHSVRDFITWTALRCAALRCAALRWASPCAMKGERG